MIAEWSDTIGSAFCSVDLNQSRLHSRVALPDIETCQRVPFYRQLLPSSSLQGCRVPTHPRRLFRASWSAPRKPSMGNVPRKLPALHRFSKITPLGHLETQFPDRQEIG